MKLLTIIFVLPSVFFKTNIKVPSNTKLLNKKNLKKRYRIVYHGNVKLLPKLPAALI